MRYLTKCREEKVISNADLKCKVTHDTSIKQTYIFFSLKFANKGQATLHRCSGKCTKNDHRIGAHYCYHCGITTEVRQSCLLNINQLILSNLNCSI